MRSAFTRFTLASVVCSTRPFTRFALSSLVSRSSGDTDLYVALTFLMFFPSRVATTPSLWMSSAFGMRSFMSSLETIGALMALGAGSPLRAVTTASATSTATPSWASTVDAPKWGVSTTFGLPIKGLSAGGGSTAKTSRAAPAISLLSKASAKALSSITPPLATLITTALGFMFLKTSALNILSVEGVRGMCREKKSPLATASSKSTSSTPRALALSSGA
mmetsp:Transcript_4926/g.14757  ORF Transcript_4926/g.14757 Transcript_4926/m.14757 type:complete len:220 (-) Transcript_4926:777-1436(-)